LSVPNAKNVGAECKKCRCRMQKMSVPESEDLILLLLNKEPTYLMLISNSEDILVSFLHVRALCLVLL
jgi:hypothetical protein